MDKWNSVRKKLQSGNKEGLIELRGELTTVSPSVAQFLHVRYLHTQDITAYPLHIERLRDITAKLSEHHWERLTDPFYQLDADMNHSTG